MMIHKRLAAASVLAVFVASPGCITLKAEHNDLAAKVTALEQQTVDRSASLDQEIELAEARLAELQVKLAEAERLLRGSQAGLGARMDDVEQQLAELRGAAENAEFVSSAAGQRLAGAAHRRRPAPAQARGEAQRGDQHPRGQGRAVERGGSPAHRPRTTSCRAAVAHLRLALPGRRPPAAEANFKVGLTFFSERDYKSALGEFYRLIQE
jgi:TolA-binding protein